MSEVPSIQNEVHPVTKRLMELTEDEKIERNPNFFQQHADLIWRLLKGERAELDLSQYSRLAVDLSGSGEYIDDERDINISFSNWDLDYSQLGSYDVTFIEDIREALKFGEMGSWGNGVSHH